ncbi:c-type cytochrome [Cyanobium sp. PCC 7001]|uniref:c-type cytochrome n=1 Tax=Cyanobium sp. PCC 7001 TaxID=180281 RepID=UPI0005BDC926|nr:c-type cytochrome [Cyanobium sp. PCC 7001]
MQSWFRRAAVALLIIGLVVSLPVQAASAALPAADGARLFENHCAGCHLNGGNIIRRRKTLRLAALERQGVASEQAIAAIAAAGVGQMGGYGDVLGDDGVVAVARWVWEQAQAGWPRS